MQALETYPPFTHNKQASNIPDDYQHADKYIRQSDNANDRANRLKKVGTLSKSEWEVISKFLN